MFSDGICKRQDLTLYHSHKTLFGAGPAKGLPIGNLNSQFFANVYLNRLDQLVKHEIKCRHYLRYCDDFVLLSHDREQLLAWRESIETFLRDELKLELNPRERLAPVANFEAQLVTTVQGVRCYRFNETVLDRLAATLSSYLGHFKLANTWNLWASIWRQFEFLSQYFAFDARNWKLVRKYQTPKACRAVRDQYRYFRRRFLDDVLFFQVGRFMECYDIGSPYWPLWLGLKRMGPNRRGARYGFPASQTGRHLRTVLKRGIGVTLVHEHQRHGHGIKARAPVWRYRPMDCHKHSHSRSRRAPLFRALVPPGNKVR